MLNETPAPGLESLRQGQLISDAEFDEIYPRELREFSGRHWTPLRIARSAANFLAVTPETRVLDIGSGAGKFCLIGAITTPAGFFGVEQRKPLTDLATELARTHDVPRAHFINANMADLDWSAFQSFYFFNPFQEQLDPTARIDDTLPCSLHRAEYYLETVRTKLVAAPAGTRVASYHGIGLELPADFELHSREYRGSGHLDLWIKR